MTTEALQHELDRLPDAADARATLHRCHLEALLCSARLQEAIDHAERWYARREATLRRFDRRATTTVWQLVAGAQVRQSLAWTP